MKLKPRLILILAGNVALTLLLTLSNASSAMAAGNQPPVANNDSYSMDENGTLNVPSPGVLGNDNDDDGDSLIAVLKHDVSYGNLTLNSNGSFYYMPNTGYTGTDTFTYQASDGQASSNTATVTITINSNNQAPILDPIGNKSVEEGQTLEFTVSATDPNEDSLVYSANNLPSGANFNQSTHVFSWTPGSGQAGTYNDIYFEVSDGSLFDFEYITIVEVKPDTGPDISRFDVTPIYESKTGELISTRIDYQIDNAEELEPGDELILRVYFDGQLWDEVQVLTLSQLQANGDTGNLSYIPSQGWTNGTYIFQAELRKNDGLVQSSHLEKFTLIPESVTAVVSWGSLGVIISITLLVVTTVVIVVLYHRRETLRGYIE